MRNLRLLPILIAVLLTLLLTVWLIDQLQRFYWQLSYSSPLLGGFLVLLLVALVISLVGAVIYYGRMFTRPASRSGRPRPQAPEQKTEAADANLQAVQRQVELIQDRIARQALLERSQAIAAELERGDLRVVVFGTGSAGKTSLVNALMGRIVGRVEATMGSTEEGQTYRLRLRGLERDICVTDTPGILEAGKAGDRRQQLARQLALEADLLIFVVDGDLRRSELEALEALVRIGKRSLLVLNKRDLYSAEEQAAILARLRERLRGLIAAQDIVTASARPQTVRLAQGERLQPPADVQQLMRRMAAVLRAEGEELVADNILLQSQRLGDEARKLLDRQRRRQAVKVVEQFQWISAGVVAVTPLPGVDLLGTVAVNAQMVVELGRVYGCEMNIERGRELALSLGRLLASLGIIKGATQLVATALQTNLATALIGKAVQGVSAAYLTRIAGRSFIEYFRRDQDWGDGGMAEVVQEQFQLEQRDAFVRRFLREAFERVVQPLARQLEGRELPPADRGS